MSAIVATQRLAHTAKPQAKVQQVASRTNRLQNPSAFLIPNLVRAGYISGLPFTRQHGGVRQSADVMASADSSDEYAITKLDV